jgi:hypothetical protein
MRKYLPLALAAFVLLSCRKEKVYQPEPVLPVVKTITFHVFAAKEYSGTAYSNTQADVVLEIRTVDYRTGAHSIVWDTTFSSRALSLYPQLEQKYIVEKSISVNESTHKLNAGYGIKYNTNGMLQQVGYGEDLSKGVKALRLEADL